MRPAVTALTAIASLLAAPAGAGAETRRSDEGNPCVATFRHGNARVTLRETHWRGGQRSGQGVRFCAARVEIEHGRARRHLSWSEIEPVGDRFGVSILPTPIGRFRALAKYGDYDGRLILVASSGEVHDLPGPDHVVLADGRLLTRHQTDEEGRFVLFDLERGATIAEFSVETIARALGADLGDRPAHVRWGLAGDDLYVLLVSGDAELTGRVHGASGVITRASLGPPQRAALRLLDFAPIRGWRDCTCRASR